jgi:uncharacterized membrane protein
MLHYRQELTFDLIKTNTVLDILIAKPEEKSVPEGVVNVSDRADKPVKSALKAITWRIVGTIDTMIISYIITGKVTVALSIGSVEVFTKMILYYFHERVWAHIHRLKLKGWIKKNGEQYNIERAE